MPKTSSKLPAHYRWLALSCFWYLCRKSTTTRFIHYGSIAQGIKLLRKKSSLHDRRMVTAIAGALATFKADMNPIWKAVALGEYAGPRPDEVLLLRSNAVYDATRWYMRKAEIREKIDLHEARRMIYEHLNESFPVHQPEKTETQICHLS